MQRYEIRCVTAFVVVALIAGLRSYGGPPEFAAPGFRALLREIHYATPLAPAKGSRAVIVYGRNAPWTKTAAEQVQTLVREWSGATLELADDLTVTSEDTWLVADAYGKTPLLVLGNGRDNRVVHALGTRYLAYSNRTWPGGDRFVIRTMFEPFVADVNYLLLESSTPAGMTGALAKFKELLAGLKADAAATFPQTILAGAGKDAWAPVGGGDWNPPKDYADLSKSVRGNAGPHRPDAARDEWGIVCRGWGRAGVAPQDYHSREPFAVAPVTRTSAADAFPKVLAEAGAARPKRDPVDRGVVYEVEAKTGKIIDSLAEVGGYPELARGDAPQDSDHDGMPDPWERQHGLDPRTIPARTTIAMETATPISRSICTR